MIRKYKYGKPFHTDAVVKEFSAENGAPLYGKTETENGYDRLPTVSEVKKQNPIFAYIIPQTQKKAGSIRACPFKCRSGHWKI